MSGGYLPLVEYRRKGVAEVVIHGAVSWSSGARKIYSYAGNERCFGRSLMKPLQIRVFAKELASALSESEKSISLASHNAEPEQLAVARKILPESQWSLVQTPASQPLILMPGAVPTSDRWNHPCSAKHAAIVRGCQLRGWPVTNYTSVDHPYHQAYSDVIKRALGHDWEPTVTAPDGCGLPTFAMTVDQLAQIFAWLAQTKDEDWIWAAMIAHPELVGGLGRLDSRLLLEGGGWVLAKEGADGLLGLSIQHGNYPEGLGVVIKIAHGWDPRATSFVATHILHTLGLKSSPIKPLDDQEVDVSPKVCPPVF